MRAAPSCRLLLALCIGSFAAAFAGNSGAPPADDPGTATKQGSAVSDESPKETEAMPANRVQIAKVETAHAAGFTLDDQFGKTHEYQFPKEKVSVLLFADREGSEQIEGWVRPLYDKYRTSVDVDGVALLKGVPELMRGTIKFLFRKQVAHPIMMDWTGETTELFDCHAKEASVFVIDTQGQIVFTTYGEATPERLASVVEAVEAVIHGERGETK